MMNTHEKSNLSINAIALNMTNVATVLVIANDETTSHPIDNATAMVHTVALRISGGIAA